MTTDLQNTDKIRRACIAANEDILKLEFGCRVVMQINWGFECTALVCAVSKKGTVSYKRDSRNYTESGAGIDKEHSRSGAYIKKILGRPIRLADVLLALSKTEHGIAISDDGLFLMWDGYGYVYDERSRAWDCKNDSLDFQTPECRTFIASLLPDT